MAKYPSIFRIRDLVKHASECQAEVSKGVWVPARPIGYSSLRHRIRCAWLVFIGKADAVIWDKQ